MPGLYENMAAGIKHGLIELCAECAPRVNVEIAAARADKMKRDIWDKADQTQVFQGEIEQKATFCPNCGAENDQSVKFCGECETKLK